jgi:hypothetical protein
MVSYILTLLMHITSIYLPTYLPTYLGVYPCSKNIKVVYMVWVTSNFYYYYYFKFFWWPISLTIYAWVEQTTNNARSKVQDLHVSSFFGANSSTTKHAIASPPLPNSLWRRFKGGPYLQLCPCILKSTEMSSNGTFYTHLKI